MHSYYTNIFLSILLNNLSLLSGQIFEHDYPIIPRQSHDRIHFFSDEVVLNSKS